MTSIKNKAKNQMDIKEIMFFEGNVNYSNLHTKNATYSSSRTLKSYEDKLDDDSFIRIHKSYIVNTKFISSLDNVRNPRSLTLKNGVTLEISRRRAKEVKQKLKAIKYI